MATYPSVPTVKPPTSGLGIRPPGPGMTTSLWAPPPTTPAPPWTPSPSQMATISGQRPPPPATPTRTPLPQTPYEETYWNGREWQTNVVDPSHGSGGGAGGGVSGPTIAGYSPSGLAGLQQELAITGHATEQAAQSEFARQQEAEKTRQSLELQNALEVAANQRALDEEAALGAQGRTKELTGYEAQLAERARQAEFGRMQSDRPNKAEAELAFQSGLDAKDLDLYAKLRAMDAGAEGGVGGPGATPAGVPATPPPVNFTGPGGPAAAAQAAAFARAKDRIGATAGGAMLSTQNQFARRGLAGTPMEGKGIAEVIGGAQGQLGEASRDIALEEAQRAQEVEDRNLAASLTQRGQDIGVRGQDIAARQAAAQLALSKQGQLQALFQAMRQRSYLY